MQAGNIIYGGISARDYGAAVDGTDTYSAPERDYETVEVPGRNGALTVDHGRYQNIEISYYMIFKGIRQMEEYRHKITSLTGYRRLEDNHHPGEYRLARLTGGFFPTAHGVGNRMAEVTVTFDCKPQRFLKSGEIPVEVTETNAKALRNPTGMDALPFIRVYGTGTVGVAGETITVKEHGKAYVDIDCELQDCFFGASNLNKFVELPNGGFPVLHSGVNGVSLGGGITKVTVIPRWWRL